MVRASLLILLVIFFFGIIPYAEALDGTYFDKSNLLLKRKNQWPNWILPGPYQNRLKSRDLFYPFWFEGLWQVKSTDLRNPESNSVVHFARFFYDDMNALIADRQFNAQSIGNVVLGDKLIEIKDDPHSSNKQVAIFKDGDFLESKVIARSQNNNNNNNFFAYEIVLQILHMSNKVSIKKVELLSEYKLCANKNTSLTSKRKPICGEQWLATYNDFNNLPLNLNHYKLEIYPISEYPIRDQNE